jgi:hypothetical protein
MFRCEQNVRKNSSRRKENNRKILEGREVGRYPEIGKLVASRPTKWIRLRNKKRSTCKEE